jgi:hypothetical protein
MTSRSCDTEVFMKPLVVRSARQSFAGVVLMLLLINCNGKSPTAPAALPQPVPPVANRAGIVWGYVYAPAGTCLLGASVEMLDGSQAGARGAAVQSDFVLDNQ